MDQLLWCGFMLWIVLDILLYGCSLYEFCVHGGFHSSTTIHGFLESSWFRGFLRGWLILGQGTIFKWFYAFNYFCYFRVTNGSFMDIVIFRDYKALTWCLGFLSLGDLGVS